MAEVSLWSALCVNVYLHGISDIVSQYKERLTRHSAFTLNDQEVASSADVKRIKTGCTCPGSQNREECSPRPWVLTAPEPDINYSLRCAPKMTFHVSNRSPATSGLPDYLLLKDRSGA